MHLGLVGLGKMGLNMALRLLADGHAVTAYDHHAENVAALTAHAGAGVKDLHALAAALPPPRCIWLMIPAGAPTEGAIHELLPLLTAGDVLIDGGNAYYRDSVRRAGHLRAYGIHFLDVGVSGGVWGRTHGYCLMIGGEREAYARVEPLFKTLAPEDGYRHVGTAGAGHYAKMVHNAIEYGMLQAYGEGFELLHASEYDFELAPLAHLWNRGSVVRSWLLELAERALQERPRLEGIEDYVEDSGEGRWAVSEAIAKDVPAPVITLSLIARLRSRQPGSFSAKFIAALRHQFGGHAVKTSPTP